MATLLNGGIGSEPTEDGDIAPLVRWALLDQVRGQEPSPTVWRDVESRLAGQRSHRLHSVRRWTTVTSATVTAVLVLAVGFSSWYVTQAPPAQLAVEPTKVVQPDAAVQAPLQPQSVVQVQARPQPERSQPPVRPDPEAPAVYPASPETTREPRIDYVPETPELARRVRTPQPPQLSVPSDPVFLSVRRGQHSTPM